MALDLASKTLHHDKKDDITHEKKESGGKQSYFCASHK